MHYIYRYHKEMNQEYTKVGIYLNKLERYKNFEMIEKVTKMCAQ